VRETIDVELSVGRDAEPIPGTTRDEVRSRSDARVNEADLELAGAALRGERWARERLVERLSCVPRMLAALNRHMGSAFDAEELQDLAQDIFALIWKKLGEFAGRSSLETWAYRFCWLELANAIRRRRREQRLAREIAARRAFAEASPRPSELEEFAPVHAGLERLSQAEARIVRMKHFEPLTFREIGARLSISPNTAKAIYYRGMLRLRSWLEPHYANSSS
jgi:RNA polymerase sigma factor (sigma-70 family)